MNKARIHASLVCASVFIVAGCASFPEYSKISGELPQIAPGQARIYVYRGNEMLGAGVITKVRLNDQELGRLAAGCFNYVDRPAGTYFVSCQTGLLDPRQGKHKLTFTLGAGQTQYIRITEHWGVITADAEPTLENKDSAIRTLSSCHYTAQK